MFVLGAYPERFEDQELFDVQVDSRRPLDQLRRDEDLHTVLFHGAVRCEVLALEVGVDRHLGPAASAQGRDKVQRGDPAFMADSIQGLFGNLELHS